MPAIKGRYTKTELLKKGPQITYRGKALSRIAFPLGGLGTGCISLGGWGQLRDWEVQNRPAKGFCPPNSFFAIKIRQEGREPRLRALIGPPVEDFVGDGHSMPRNSGEGLPGFQKAAFKGEYPFAFVRLEDPELPVRVVLEAFNPLIPLNDRDSGIPVAILLYRVRNSSRSPIHVSIYGSLSNFVGGVGSDGQVNEGRTAPGMTGLFMTNKKIDASSPRGGSLALVTPWEDAGVWPQWPDGPANLWKFWEAVALADEFPPPITGNSPTGTVAAHTTIGPGSEITLPFFITWHFPVVEHWRRTRGPNGLERTATWRNYYATLWDDAWDVAEYVVSTYDRLYEESRHFHDVLFASTLPTHVLDAVSSQLSVLRSPTCLRLEDGTFYGFEGCNPTSGCCEGSCTHVWNYAQALAYLFPSLQRSMVESHLRYSMEEDGFVHFRLELPRGRKPARPFVPAADGQMGLVVQVYREWLLSGDQEWLEEVWPLAKRALEFAWKYWDRDRDGVIEGVQHNTYDMEWWGPNTMVGSLYLAALRAAERMASAVGDEKSAATYRQLAKRGAEWTDRHLFNGEYYEQQVEPKANAHWPEPFRSIYDRGRDDRFPDWPRWQFGKGCLADQLIGQWQAALLGLGHLYERRNVRKALAAIFKHNWRPTLKDHVATNRIYAAHDEAGLLLATWPRGERPGYAFWFADEVWPGVEYQVASHLIHEGMVEEGLAIVKGLRDRFRGERRNPWDEFECGHHYARSLASYGLLLALSGFTYCAAENTIGFAPKVFEDDFRAFFCVEGAWGSLRQKLTREKKEVAISVEYGELAVRRVLTPLLTRKTTPVNVTLAGLQRETIIEKTEGGYAVAFLRPLLIERGETLRIVIS